MIYDSECPEVQTLFLKNGHKLPSHTDLWKISSNDDDDGSGRKWNVLSEQVPCYQSRNKELKLDRRNTPILTHRNKAWIYSRTKSVWLVCKRTLHQADAQKLLW